MPTSAEGQTRPMQLWRQMTSLKQLEDENMVRGIAALLDITVEEVKNIPMDNKKRPRLMILPNEE